eukprot:6187060-Pleurochrysis_carterae.AAC.1
MCVLEYPRRAAVEPAPREWLYADAASPSRAVVSRTLAYVAREHSGTSLAIALCIVQVSAVRVDAASSSISVIPVMTMHLFMDCYYCILYGDLTRLTQGFGRWSWLLPCGSQ